MLSLCKEQIPLVQIGKGHRIINENYRKRFIHYLSKTLYSDCAAPDETYPKMNTERSLLPHRWAGTVKGSELSPDSYSLAADSLGRLIGLLSDLPRYRQKRFFAFLDSHLWSNEKENESA